MKILNIITLLMSLNLVCAQSLDVHLVDAYSQARINVSSKSEKANTIVLMNEGKYKVLFNNLNYNNTNDRFNCLIGERKIITFDLINLGNNELSNIEISSNVPIEWNAIFMRQALLNDWYSNQNKNIDQLLFIGDPLLNLKSFTPRSFVVDLRAKETARIVLEFRPTFPFNNSIQININKKNFKKTLKVPLVVFNKKLPETEFSSIAFDGTNALTGTSIFPTLKNIGFTHLQVNFIPVVYFDKFGNPLGKTFVHNETNTVGFKNTAIEWIRLGGKIMLFWQPRYNILAPLSKGEYLKPYTPEWNNAFCSLLEITVSELKKTYPDFNRDQVILYLADEVSSARGTLSNYLQLSQYIKKRCPGIKIFSTFGYYSMIDDINTLSSTLDISSMHFFMPEKVRSNNKDFFPFTTKIFFDQLKKTKMKKWYYNVENGIKADIRNFRLFPLIAAANNYEGFSWWAFASNTGSMWMNNSSNGLNYSLYYKNEPQNKIYQMWNADSGKNTGPIITSMRLKAIEAGLNDARLITLLIGKTSIMKKPDFDRFTRIINNLSNLAKLPESEFTYMELREIENISYTLREIYASLPD